MPPLSDGRAGHVSQVPVVTAPAAPDHRSRSRAQLLERLSVSSPGSGTSHQLRVSSDEKTVRNAQTSGQLLHGVIQRTRPDSHLYYVCHRWNLVLYSLTGLQLN